MSDPLFDKNERLDINFPSSDDLEVLLQIRAMPEGASTPVVMLLASDDQKDLDEALKAGANAFLVKAFGLAKMRVRLEALLSFAPIVGTSSWIRDCYVPAA